MCENCKLCTYWYHLVRVFASSPPMPILPWYANFKKINNQIPIPDGYVKNPIPVLHWNKPPSVQIGNHQTNEFRAREGSEDDDEKKTLKNPKLLSLSYSTCCWLVESSFAYVSILSHGSRSKYSIAATTKQTHPQNQKPQKQRNKQIDRKKTEESVSSYMISIGCSSWPEEEPKRWKSQATSGDK